jgi:hypothetical protein
LLVLDDENYRDITISLIEKFTDFKIKINGSFKLNISQNPTINASVIQIYNRDNDYNIDIGNLNIAITLRSLFFSNLRITNLQLNDIDITINRTLLTKNSSVNLTQESHEIEKLLLPILEHAIIKNMTLSIQRQKTTLTNYFILKKLTLGLNKKKNKHILDGNGLLNNYNFEIDGSFGNLTNLLKSERFPISTDIQLASMKINIDGYIQDVLTGSGLNLKFKVNTNDFLKVFRGNNSIPYLGSFKAHAYITGNLPNIAINNIDLSLKNTSNNYISISGKIPELKTGLNTNLKVTSLIKDPLIYKWLTPKNWPKINSMTANFSIINDKSNYIINNIKINSKIDRNTSLKIIGSAAIKNISRQPFKDINLVISANSPSSKILQQYVSNTIPNIKPIKLNARLVSIKDYYSLKEISATVGDPAQLNLQVTGHINTITPNSKNKFSGIQLKIRSHVKSLQDLEGILKQPLPNLQNLKFTAELRDENNLISLNNILINSDSKSQNLLEITGSIANIKNGDGLVLNSNLNIKTKNLLTVITDAKKYPELGRTKGTFSTHYKNGNLILNKINIKVFKSDEWLFTAKGKVEQLLSNHKYSIKTSSKISNWSTLKKMLNKDNFDFQPESGNGELTGNKNKITFHNSFKVGKTRFNFGVSAIKNSNRYELSTFLESPLFHLDDFGIKPKDNNLNKTTKKTSDNTNNEIISNETLPFEKLDSINLAAKIKIDQFSGNDNYLKALDINLTIKNGDLRLHPALLNFSDGNVSLDMGLSANKKHDSYVKLNIKDVDLGSIMSQLQKTPIIKGSLSAAINIQSFGDSFQKIASNSTGDITVVGENIEVLRKYTNLLVSDTLGWASSSIGLTKKYSQWSCSILKFDIANSNIKSDVMIVDGPDIRVKGKLNINLSNETIDMSLWPKQKNSLWLNARPVTLSGPISKPDVNTLTVGTSNVARTYGELILAPQLFIPLRALGYINSNIINFTPTSKEGPCQKLEKEILEDEQKNKQGQ